MGDEVSKSSSSSRSGVSDRPSESLKLFSRGISPLDGHLKEIEDKCEGIRGKEGYGRGREG